MTPFNAIDLSIQEHARRTPDKNAVSIDGERLTYRELDLRTRDLTASLQSRGVQRGDIVALCADSSVDCLVAQLAISAAGAVLAQIAPWLTGEAVAALIVQCQPKLVLADETAPVWRSAAASIIAPVIKLEDLREEAGVATFVERSHKDIYAIVYTSGTTSRPKGIVQSFDTRWRVLAGLQVAQEPDIVLVATPLYSNMTTIAVGQALVQGASIVMSRRFDVRTAVELMGAHKPTVAWFVPTQIDRIVSSLKQGSSAIRSLQQTVCAGAPWSFEAKRRALDIWPGQLIEIYSLSEGGSLTTHVLGKRPEKLGTVGRPFAGYDMRIVDASGSELEPGNKGEIVGRHPGMMEGYYCDERSTREAEWLDGEGRRFVRTGDLGSFDSEGFLSLSGRKKELIISGGANVYPSDLIAVLSAHPHVSDAAVVGVPSSLLGEAPAALVVPRAGAPAAAQILEWANARLGKPQRIRQLFYDVELPRSPAGKLAPQQIRARILALAGAQQSGESAA